jgi:hypothetical protein
MYIFFDWKALFAYEKCGKHLATWEAMGLRTVAPGQPWQKTFETPFQPIKAGHGGAHPVTPVTVGSL